VREHASRRHAIEVFEPHDVSELDLSLIEVKQLWLDMAGSSIMDAGARRRTVRSWGPCPRHVWLQAIVEIELRGGVPFTVTILYADLAERAAHAVMTGRADALQPADGCMTCQYCGYAKPDTMFSERTHRANRQARTRALLGELRPQWAHRACPDCVADRSGFPCRPHLTRATRPAGEDFARLSTYLHDLAARLYVYQKSLTLNGPPAGPTHQASWIEALGFFAGWQPAHLLTR
jgi:hypothetical protein